MDEKELTIPKIDLIFIFRIWLRYAKRFWAMALIFAFLCAGVLGYTGYRAYTPVYEMRLRSLHGWRVLKR